MRISLYLKFIFAFILALCGLSKVFAADLNNKDVLVLIDSSGGNTYKLAESIKSGIENKGLHAIIKKVPNQERTTNDLDKIPVVSADELVKYSGIAFGSPIYIGCTQESQIKLVVA